MCLPPASGLGPLSKVVFETQLPSVDLNLRLTRPMEERLGGVYAWQPLFQRLHSSPPPGRTSSPQESLAAGGE